MKVKGYQTFLIPVEDIKILPDRQRKDLGDLTGLINSIRNRGQLVPIVINEKDQLIAGERRLTALKQMSEKYVVCRYIEDMNERELKLLEWDENFHRQDLSWQEQAHSVRQIHELQSEEGEWTVSQTAESLGVTSHTVSRYLSLARALDTQDPQLLACVTFSAAYNWLERKRANAADQEVNRFFEVARGATSDAETADETSDDAVSGPIETGPGYRVQAESFHTWAQAYTGPRFDFIHLDPPYGIDHNKSDSGNAAAYGDYEDSKDEYFKFLETLIRCKQNLFLDKSHVMLWFSMKHYTETIEILESGFEEDRIRIVRSPLIWHKSDGIGIMPDASREPKRVYETALMFSLGDRKILRTANNTCSLPANKHRAKHASEKPVIVLMEFFRMFVGRYTRVLDPCFGSGTSIAAALQCHAAYVHGLDLNPEYVKLGATAAAKALSLVSGNPIEESNPEE